MTSILSAHGDAHGDVIDSFNGPNLLQAHSARSARSTARLPIQDSYHIMRTGHGIDKDDTGSAAQSFSDFRGRPAGARADWLISDC